MKRRRFSWGLILAACAAVTSLTGCNNLGRGVAEVGLAGAGGAIGYEASDHRIGGAAAGAAVGYLAAKVARHEVQHGENEAEKRGYDRAMNQAVKQQYWIIQNQQRDAKAAPAAQQTMYPVVVPESNAGGVIRNASIAYVPVGP